MSLHRYTYCANNPLRYTDPGGHFFGALLRFVGGAVAGIGGVFGAVSDFIADYRKHARVKRVPVPVEVERVHYECVNHVPDCPNHVNNIRVVTRDTKWEMQEVWEYGGTDRSFADYLGDHAGKNSEVKIKGIAERKNNFNVSGNVNNIKNTNDVLVRYMPDGSKVIDFTYLPGESGIEVPRRLSVKEMSFLTREYNVEFAQVYKYGSGMDGGGGKYFVYSGDIKSVPVPIEKDVMLINQYPSKRDYISKQCG